MHEPTTWSWAFRTDTLAEGARLTITLAMGSGAARVFDQLRRAHDHTVRMLGGAAGKSLVVWLGFGTTWSCGACFSPTRTTYADLSFLTQIWLSADDEDEYHWADTITGHELGHWVMESFGTSPGEGGAHMIGVPTFPGQAWSEGFATWFSSDARDDGVFLLKQRGSMFWFHIGARAYHDGRTWTLPDPEAGLLQKMDEHEVSAMLWELRNHEEGDVRAMYAALASPHMNTSPWPRGNTRHTWYVGSGGRHEHVVNTGVSRPCLADYLDALNCAGYSRRAIASAASPGERYPYDPDQPLCR